MRSDNQGGNEIFFSWVVDRYTAHKKSKELGYKNKFGCPKCTTGTMNFDEKVGVYFCSKPNCLSGSIKSLVGH